MELASAMETEAESVDPFREPGFSDQELGQPAVHPFR